jgi:hypothetical protein
MAGEVGPNACVCGRLPSGVDARGRRHLSAAPRRRARSVRQRGLHCALAAWRWPSAESDLGPSLAPGCTPRSKVQEAVEQIEFDLGMLDESIER